MTLTLLFFVSLTLLSTALAEDEEVVKCPDNIPEVELSLGDLVGEWYEAEKSINTPWTHKTSFCTTYTFHHTKKLKDLGKRLEFEIKFRKLFSEGRHKGKLELNNCFPNTTGVTFHHQKLRWAEPHGFHVQVLDFKPDQFLVLYSCEVARNWLGTDTRYEYAWVLTRNHPFQLDAWDVYYMEEKLKNYTDMGTPGHCLMKTWLGQC
ncbi:uncharacterized protein LOC142349479 [Convolutriloba macropyga]|uniref:uncharacterized protein LOC142349479 n=1 Tax=Convolutriloba macropyga TaxID=536237 RepID=UPI003F51F111